METDTKFVTEVIINCLTHTVGNRGRKQFMKQKEHRGRKTAVKLKILLRITES